MKYGLIAGGGSFPLLVLEAARREGRRIVTAAIREEASPEVEERSEQCHWISLGQLSKLIEIFHRAGVRQAVMAGRVRHNRIFSAIRPDWRLLKLLGSLRRKNTDSLLGAVAGALADEGIELIDSTFLLGRFLAAPGANAGRGASREEAANVAYGLGVARALAGFDIGQSVVICEQACVAVEAMEGTDAVLLRAGGLANGRKLTLVKEAKPNQDMRFDVPTIGPRTIRKMRQAGATAVSVTAGKTLLLEKDDLLREADAAGIAVIGS